MSREPSVKTGIKLIYGDKTVTFSTEQLLGALANYGIMQSAEVKEVPQNIALFVEKDGLELHAAIYPKEDDYPGIDIDGKDREGEAVYVANVELPNETYPHSVAARLYAGHSAYETDSPIALVTSDMRPEKIQAYKTYITEKGGPMHKFVHVDTDLARASVWPDRPDLEEHDTLKGTPS